MARADEQVQRPVLEVDQLSAVVQVFDGGRAPVREGAGDGMDRRQTIGRGNGVDAQPVPAKCEQLGVGSKPDGAGGRGMSRR
jgi:hypothetical protein